MSDALCSNNDGAAVHSKGLCKRCYSRNATRKARGTPLDAPVQRKRESSRSVTVRLDGELLDQALEYGTATAVVEAALRLYVATQSIGRALAEATPDPEPAEPLTPRQRLLNLVSEASRKKDSRYGALYPFIGEEDLPVWRTKITPTRHLPDAVAVLGERVPGIDLGTRKTAPNKRVGGIYIPGPREVTAVDIHRDVLADYLVGQGLKP